MADLGSSLKSIFMKGMESIGNAATNIANNTKTKVDEMNMVNRRTEILADFGNRAYALWLKGESFPQELNDLLKELKDLDEKLNDLRTEKYANIRQKKEEKEVPVLQTEKEPAEDGAPAEESVTEPAEEPLEEKAGEEEIPVIRVEKEPEAPASASEAIEDLFNKVPDTETVQQKVEETLDSISEGMDSLSREIDKGLEELSDKINPPEK